MIPKFIDRKSELEFLEKSHKKKGLHLIVRLGLLPVKGVTILSKCYVHHYT